MKIVTYPISWLPQKVETEEKNSRKKITDEFQKILDNEMGAIADAKNEGINN